MVTAVDVKDAAGVTRNVNTLPALGRAAAASSLPDALCTEDKAVLDAVSATLGATNGAAVGTDANGTLQQYLRGLVIRALAPATGTQTNVASGAADVTILASNANRKGACIFNDDANALLLLFANDTAAATKYSVRVEANDYVELPVCQGGVYTGVIKGIWVADGSGSARVTEFT